MTVSMGTNGQKIIVANQDANTNKLNTLITSDNGVGAINYDTICEFRSDTQAVLMPRIPTVNAAELNTPGMIYYDKDADMHIAVTASMPGGQIILGDSTGNLTVNGSLTVVDEIFLDNEAGLQFLNSNGGLVQVLMNGNTTNQYSMSLPSDIGTNNYVLTTDGGNGGTGSIQTYWTPVVNNITISGDSNITANGAISATGDVNVSLTFDSIGLITSVASSSNITANTVNGVSTITLNPTLTGLTSAAFTNTSNTVTISANANGVNSDFVLPSNLPVDGSFLQTDASGNTSWQSISSGAVTDVTAGSNNITVSPTTGNVVVDLATDLTGMTSINTDIIINGANITTTGNIAATNIPATIAFANPSTPASTGKMIFSKDSTGADLVGSFGGTNITADTTGNLTTTLATDALLQSLVSGATGQIILSSANASISISPAFVSMTTAPGSGVNISSSSLNLYNNQGIGGAIQLIFPDTSPNLYGLTFPVGQAALGQSLITTDGNGALDWFTPTVFTEGVTKGITSLDDNGPSSVSTKVITTAAVTINSRIFVNKNLGNNLAPTTATTFSVVGVAAVSNGSFTIYSSIAQDPDQVNWLIIN